MGTLIPMPDAVQGSAVAGVQRTQVMAPRAAAGRDYRVMSKASSSNSSPGG